CGWSEYPALFGVHPRCARVLRRLWPRRRTCPRGRRLAPVGQPHSPGMGRQTRRQRTTSANRKRKQGTEFKDRYGDNLTVQRDEDSLHLGGGDAPTASATTARTADATAAITHAERSARSPAPPMDDGGPHCGDPYDPDRPDKHRNCRHIEELA